MLVSKNTEERMFVVDSGASMHILSKKDLSSDEMETLQRSRTPTTVVTANGEVQTRKHKCTFTTSICSSQCNYSVKRQQFYRLVRQTVKLHVPGLSSSSSGGSASASRPKDQSKSHGKPETPPDPVTTRSAKHACGKPMQTNPDKQASGSRGLAHTENEMDEEDPTQGIPDWLQPFKENLEDLEAHVPAHSSERGISDSEGDASKVETIWQESLTRNLSWL